MSSKTVSSKVSLGTLGGAALGLITTLLVYFIPAWHSGLPGYVSLILPVIMAGAGHFASGYSAKHRATTDEILRAVDEAEQLLHLLPRERALNLAQAAVRRAQEPVEAPVHVEALPPTSDGGSAAQPV